MLGELLYARYKVIQVLGAGGFSQTYIAEDTQRPGNPCCVLKHLFFESPRPELLRQARRLFQVEAESLEKLGHHDRIPRLLAYFEHHQEFFLVQEYIAGRSLGQELTEQRLFSVPRVVDLLEDVLQTLAFVHERGVIHRDIKPDNLIRRASDQRYVLIDFGAVKAIGTTAIAEAGETHLSSPIYTPGYAASEQCLGQPRYASDIYSLAMVALQALTGLRPMQLPQDEATCEIIWRDKTEVDERLAAILDRMSRYHIRDRYRDVSEVLEDLAAYRAGKFPKGIFPTDNLQSELPKTNPVVTSVLPGYAPTLREDQPGIARDHSSARDGASDGVLSPSSSTAPGLKSVRKIPRVRAGGFLSSNSTDTSPQMQVGTPHPTAASQRLDAATFGSGNASIRQAQPQPQSRPRRRQQTLLAIVGGLLLGVGGMGGMRWLMTSNQLLSKPSPQPVPISNAPQPQSTPSVTPNELAKRISWGDRLLTTWQQTSQAKQEGIKAMAEGQYSRAVTQFTQARQQDPTDPETLVYLNNARIAEQPTYGVAVALSFEVGFSSNREILQGVAQLQDTVNRQGGIGGKPLKLLLLDDAQKPAIAQALAHHLVDKPDVLAVIGHVTSDTSLSAAQVYEGKLVMVSPISSAVKLSGLGQWIFRTMPSDRMTAQALSQHLFQTLGKQRAVVFYNRRSGYSQSLKAEFENALFYNKGKVVGEFDLSLPNFDATLALQTAKAKQAEVILLAPDNDSLKDAVQVVEVNQGKMPILGGDVVFHSKFLSTGAEGQGLVVGVPLVATTAQPKAFQRQFDQLWSKTKSPTEPQANWRAALAYDALQAVVTALQKEPSRRGIQAQLRRSGFVTQGATGPVSFQASGDRTSPVSLMEIQQQNGKYQFVPLRP